MEFVKDGACIVSRDWGLRNWRKNEAFNKGVTDGYLEHPRAQYSDLDLLRCSRLKATLKEAARNSDQEKVHEALIYPSSKEMCWSSDTLTENASIIQDPFEFSFNEFMEELRNAAEISGPTRA